MQTDGERRQQRGADWLSGAGLLGVGLVASALTANLTISFILAAIFCAAGNYKTSINCPAKHRGTIAVGASTDKGTRAKYSTKGPELDLVAPSSGGAQKVYTTDVANPRRYYGYNAGYQEQGGEEALFTTSFTGTSAATPIAAAAGALVLSANPELGREELRGVLIETAEKIGGGYDADGHSERYGYGRQRAMALSCLPVFP